VTLNKKCKQKTHNPSETSASPLMMSQVQYQLLLNLQSYLRVLPDCHYCPA